MLRQSLAHRTSQNPLPCPVHDLHFAYALQQGVVQKPLQHGEGVFRPAADQQQARVEGGALDAAGNGGPATLLPGKARRRKLLQTGQRQSQLLALEIEVDLPAETPGVPEHALIVDEPVDNVVELRAVLARRLPEAAEQLADRSLNVAVNDQLLVAGEQEARVANGDRVTLMPMLGGG